jgi:hypothetical protein
MINGIVGGKDTHSFYIQLNSFGNNVYIKNSVYKWFWIKIPIVILQKVLEYGEEQENIYLEGKGTLMMGSESKKPCIVGKVVKHSFIIGCKNNEGFEIRLLKKKIKNSFI